MNASVRDGARRRAARASADGVPTQTQAWPPWVGNTPASAAVGDDQLDAPPRQTGEVGVLQGAAVAAVLDDLGADRARHPGRQTVGTDHEPRRDLHLRPGPVETVHARDPAGGVPQDARAR